MSPIQGTGGVADILLTMLNAQQDMMSKLIALNVGAQVGTQTAAVQAAVSSNRLDVRV